MTHQASDIKTVNFNALPSEARAHLLEIFSNPKHPAHLLSDISGRRGGLFVLIVGLVFLGVGVSFAIDSLGNPWSIAGHRLEEEGIVYGLCLFFGVAGVLAGLRRMFLTRQAVLPGRYILPLDIIDARSPMMKIYHLKDMVDFNAQHHHTNGTYTMTVINFIFPNGVKQTFNIQDKIKATKAIEALDSSRQAIIQGLKAGDLTALVANDPFATLRLKEDWSGVSSPKAPKPADGPSMQSVNPLLRWRWLLALALAPALTYFGIQYRNHIHDDMLLETYRKGPSNPKDERAVEMYADDLRAYVSYNSRRGKGRHVKEVTTLWDEACFQIATLKDTTEAYQDYLNPSMNLSACNDLPLPLLHEEEAAFLSAKKQNSVTALRNYLKQYPQNTFGAEAKAQIHDLFESALASYKAKASDNLEAKAFVETLLVFMETNNSPPFQVRFLAPSTDALSQADKDFQATALPGETVIPVSPYFTEASAIQRELVITQKLQGGFAKVFPADILELSMGNRLEKIPPSFDTPIIAVSYKIGASGMSYQSDKDPSKVFVGISLTFWVSMFLPNDPKPLTFDLTVNPPETFYVESSYDEYGISTDKNGLIYSVMAARAFDELSTKMSNFFFASAKK